MQLCFNISDVVFLIYHCAIVSIMFAISVIKRYRDVCNHDKPTGRPGDEGEGWRMKSVRWEHRCEIFHPDLPKRKRAARHWREYARFLRVLVSLCAYPRKKRAATNGHAFTRPCTTRVCTGGVHPRAPISIIHPSVPCRGDMRQQQTAARGAHVHELERERARASRDRGGKFHSRIHSLANRFPAWVEYIEIIWANTTSSVMKFAEGLASSRLSCLRLSVPISSSPPLPVPFPPHFASHSSSSARSNPTLLLYLFVLALSSSSSRPPLAPSPPGIANLPEWYLLKIGSIATWVFACSSYTFRLPLTYNIYTRACVVVDSCISMIRMYARTHACVCVCVYVCVRAHASSSPQTARILSRVSRRGLVGSHWISFTRKVLGDRNRFRVIRNCLASLSSKYVNALSPRLPLPSSSSSSSRRSKHESPR